MASNEEEMRLPLGCTTFSIAILPGGQCYSTREAVLSPEVRLLALSVLLEGQMGGLACFCSTLAYEIGHRTWRGSRRCAQ
jgi:hypothetical protein